LIETMTYTNLAGPLDDLDRIISQYLSRYDIQLEYAAQELEGNEGLFAYRGGNPYTDALQKAELFLRMGLKRPERLTVSGEDALELVARTHERYEAQSAALKSLEAEREIVQDCINSLAPFDGLNFPVERLHEFQATHCRFGRMPVSNYRQFETFLYNEPEILFVESKEGKDYVYGVYFVPGKYRERVDSQFSSLHFERIHLITEADGEPLTGAPAEAIAGLQVKRDALQGQINRLTGEIGQGIAENRGGLAEACYRVRDLFKSYDIKKYAARTRKDFYLLVGWMSAPDALALEQEVEEDEKVIFVKNPSHVTPSNAPPTVLKNPPGIRFFEFFVRMYGLPSYSETDPTPVLAVTYTLLFGVMFGDLGQGAVISILGILLYRIKHMALGAIMGVIGVSSMVFGAVYGTVFGFENLIPHLYQPAADIMGTLIRAGAAGAALLIAAMVVNMVNAIRQRDLAKLFFGPNGLAGLLFYGGMLGIVLAVVTGRTNLVGLLVGVFLVVPILLIALREPLGKLLERQKGILEDGLPLFIIQTVIELFDVLLSYFTNTISFVRVGAFALSHASMMAVVLMLSQTVSASGAAGHNWLVIVVGNLLVMALEGLVVGIQGLRLEFYEMFSRFYEGNGREFESYKK